MISYKNKQYKDYLELFISFVQKDEYFNYHIFPHSQYFYIRALLQREFPNKKFTIRQIREIIAEELRLKTITLKEIKGI